MRVWDVRVKYTVTHFITTLIYIVYCPNVPCQFLDQLSVHRGVSKRTTIPTTI